ncbi:MAG: SBBP repeat-containing protein [Candidatus Syntrophosphaera sp.]
MLLISIATAGAQTLDWDWAASAGGTGYDWGANITTDSQGNQYVTGSFNNTAYFGSTSLVSSGYTDIYVAKLDPSGNWLWAVKAGGTGEDSGLGIGADSLGNVYLTGRFQNQVYFGSTLLTCAGSSYEDIFVAKLDTDGNWQWAIRAGADNSDIGQDIAVDGAGNSYVTGWFCGTVDFGAVTLSSSNPYDYDIFAAKVDPDGNWLWAERAGGTGYDHGYLITVDAEGFSYISGDFMDFADFGGIPLWSQGPNNTNHYVAKVGDDGGFMWAKSMYGDGPFTPRGIGVDNMYGVYMTGDFQVNAVFDAITLNTEGGYDIFVAKLVAYDGNWEWVTQAGGPASMDRAYGLDVDNSGNICVTGSFIDSCTFGGNTLYSGGTSIGNIFLARLDSNSNWLDATGTGGPGYPETYDIDVDTGGNIYLSGNFQGTTVIGSTSLTSHGGTDIMVCKLGVKAISLVSDPALDFGSLTLGEQSEWLDVVFSNTGTTHLVISEAQFYGDPPHFELEADPAGMILAPGETDTLRVRFNPQQAGIHNDILHIINNSSNQPDLQISLAGAAQFPIWSGNMVVSQNVVVPHGIILQVEPGTQVQFAPGAGIDVYGSLHAPGTATNRIIFSAQNEAQGWDGLAFLGENTEADSSYVSYSVINHASTGTGDPSSGGLIHVDGYEALNVSNCVLSNGSASKGGALAVLDSSAEFYNCELHHNVALEGGGAVYLENASPLLAHLSIVENSSFT